MNNSTMRFYSKDFTQRTQRYKDHKGGIKGYCSKSKRGFHDKLTDETPFSLFFVIFSSFVPLCESFALYFLQKNQFYTLCFLQNNTF
jgi:hypothetical protein